MNTTTPSNRTTRMRRARLDALLRFDPATEALHEREHAASRRTHIVQCSIFAIILFNIYNVTTVYLMPDVLQKAVILRTFVMTPLAILALWIMTLVAGALREGLLSIGVTLAFTVPIWLFSATQSPLGAFTLSDLGVFWVFGNMLLVMRFVYALLFTVTTFSIAVMAILTKAGLPDQLGVALILQNGTIAIFTLYANYTVERRRCIDFLRTAEARARAAHAIGRNEELTTLSETDPLTGLPNRRRLESVLNRAFADDHEVTLMILDIDHFKRYNDTLGHPAGDACLKQVADALAKLADGPDRLAARVGGEEFVLMACHLDDDAARRLASRVVQVIAGMQIPHPGRPDDLSIVTISLGVAQRRLFQSITPMDLMAQADGALYAAKSAGRNRVRAA